MFCFNEFAFTVQVKHKINSTQILGFILICLYFTTGHFRTRVLCKECSLFPILILGSVFSDCGVFYGDYVSDARFTKQYNHLSHCRGTARQWNSCQRVGYTDHLYEKYSQRFARLSTSCKFVCHNSPALVI